MKKTALPYLFFAFLHLGLFATAGTAGQITVTDFSNSHVQLARPAERIVCLIESALSGLYMLGVQDRLIGVSTNIYQDEVFRYYAAMDTRVAARQLPVPGNWDFVNIESVVGLQPDLVIIWADQIEVIEALRRRGIAVYGVELTSFADVFQEIRDLGVLCGVEQRAAQLLAYTEGQLASLAEKRRSLLGATKPSVYFMWSQGLLETSGSPSTVNDLIELGGGRNVAGDSGREHLVVNIERLIGWQPQVIVMWYNPRLSTEDIAAMPVWQALPAAQNDRIYQLPSVFFCDLWTLKFIHAAKLIMSWCYPGEMTGTDLRAEKRAMLVALYGEDVGGKVPLEE